VTGDRRRSQEDIDATSDQEWFDVLSGRKPPRPGNTSEARAGSLKRTLDAIYADDHSSAAAPDTTAVEAGESGSARAPRRPRRARWVEYSAVASVAALAGFFAGHVVDVQRESGVPAGESGLESHGERGLGPHLERGPAERLESIPPDPARAPASEVVPKSPFEGFGDISESAGQIHYAQPESTMTFPDPVDFRHFLERERVVSIGTTEIADGEVFVFLMPDDSSVFLRGALRDLGVEAEPGDMVILKLSGGSTD